MYLRMYGFYFYMTSVPINQTTNSYIFSLLNTDDINYYTNKALSLCTVRICICMYARMYFFMYVFMHVHMSVCMYYVNMILEQQMDTL